MIRKKEYFSRKPIGMIWLCSDCDQIHIHYGNVTATLEDQLVEELLEMACEGCQDEPHCHECDETHLGCRHATIHLKNQDFDQFLIALYRLMLKDCQPSDSKPHFEQIHHN